ncbi:MAG TPA: hypothetical protein VFZ66_24630 [Herpetosiphonaceae bacterium]
MEYAGIPPPQAKEHPGDRRGDVVHAPARTIGLPLHDSPAVLLIVSSAACAAFLRQPETRPRLGHIDDLRVGEVVMRDLLLPIGAPRHAKAKLQATAINIPLYLVRLAPRSRPERLLSDLRSGATTYLSQVRSSPS